MPDDEKNTLESINCEICGKDAAKTIFNERGYNIVKCTGCGLVYVNPRIPVQEYAKSRNLTYSELVNNSLQSCNPGALNSATIKKEKLIRPLYLESKLKQAEADLNFAEKYFKSPGRVLDIGCGEGFFLKVAVDRGWEGQGVEHSQKHSPDKKYGLNVIDKDIMEANLTKGYFNLVTFWDTLEHMPHPSEVLTKAYSLLKEGGLVVIRVPNERYLRLKSMLISGILGKDFYLKSKIFNIVGFYAPETHFFNFSEKTIKLILEKSGFRPLEIKFGKFTKSAVAIRDILHNCFYFTAKLIYSLSAKKINLNCSLIIFAKKPIPEK